MEIMIEHLLAREEGKTLEFKENSQSLHRIVQTVIAFANTAGGTLLLGIKDATKEVIGLKNILEDELRIANAIAASVSPLLVPNFQFSSWRHRDVLIITIPHSLGPYFLTSKGEKEGAFIRFGSTNRFADAHTLAEIKRLKDHTAFDQLPDCSLTAEALDLDLAHRLFENAGKSFTKGSARSLELLVDYQSKQYPSKGGLLLFGKNREELFPDPLVRLARFEGTSKNAILDHLDLKSPLPIALDEILMFIRRNTSTRAIIQDIHREEIPQYQPVVLREAVLNALTHADYSNRHSPIHIAIFDDRLEITNPGSLPFGLSLEVALTGVSQLRNKVLGRSFRELKLTDQWGSGLNRMIHVCQQNNIMPPKFEELGQFFRVTLYPKSVPLPATSWHVPIIEYIQKEGSISAKVAQQIWQISRRSATNRLQEMCAQGLLVEMSTAPRDPYKTFILTTRG